eukprot:7584645-Prorocentrum_lima.AAC.1
MRRMSVQRDTHILFDEASAHLVLENKKLFQGPPAVLQLGQTTTNSFGLSTCGKKLFITSNTWSREVDKCSATDR